VFPAQDYIQLNWQNLHQHSNMDVFQLRSGLFSLFLWKGKRLH